MKQTLQQKLESMTHRRPVLVAEDDIATFLILALRQCRAIGRLEALSADMNIVFYKGKSNNPEAGPPVAGSFLFHFDGPSPQSQHEASFPHFSAMLAQEPEQQISVYEIWGA